MIIVLVYKATKKTKRRKKNRNKQVEGNYGGPLTMEKCTSHNKALASYTKINKLGFHKKPLNKKNEVNAELKMSDNRLEAYGLAPNPFKRKKIKEKYRKEDK